MGGARRWIIGILGVVVSCCLLSMCAGALGGGNRAVATPTVAPTERPTARPTNTPVPTNTSTPEPTATPTLIPATAQAMATIAVRNSMATASAFATQDAIASKSATATVVAEKQTWNTVDVRDLIKDPEKYKTKRVAYSGQVFNIEESRGLVVMQIWVMAGGQREAIIVSHVGDSTGIYKGTNVKIYGVVSGAISGTNAFGGEVSQPHVLAAYVDRQ